MLAALGYLILVAGIIALGVHIYRHRTLHNPTKPKKQIPFDGTIYQLGDVVVAKRRMMNTPGKTVICMPGFMETMSYFFDVYKDEEDVELILVNNCGYHSPINTRMSETPSWFNPSNPFQAGTIEHDAFIIGQVVDNLVTTNQIVLHGHSRGGAVMLESAKHISQQNRQLAAILEAPVLPQGKARGHEMPKFMRMLMKYYLPLVFHYYRDNALSYLRFGGYRHPATPVKEKIISEYFSNPKHYRVAVTNIESIDRWTESNNQSMYQYLDDISVLIPAKDIVLDRNYMIKSSAMCDHVKRVDVEKADHFISLERPDFIQRYVHSLFTDSTKPQTAKAVVN
ncbi:MAG: alpha/beta hydrolase [Pseudomonadales bacterium]|nr:alpha/beta hydrolase [Pseudomonadales bacterium]